MADACSAPAQRFRSWTEARVLGLSLAMWLAPLAQAAEPLLRTSDGSLVLPSGEPLYLFRLTYSVRQVWADQPSVLTELAWRAKPEPLFVEGQDKVRREILVRTTLRGRDLLREGMAVEGPETPAARHDCVDLFVSFKIGATAPPTESVTTRAGAPCPWSEVVDPERQLVVEGLDRRGKRLYAVLADDPRWRVHESADEQGHLQLLRRGREAAPSAYVRFQAPDVGGRLRRLKIWQFGSDGRGAPIAVILFEAK